MSRFGWGRHLFNKLKKIHTSLSGQKKLFHRSQRQTFYGDLFAFQWGECETVRKNDTHSQKGQSKLVDSLLLHITKRWKKRTDMEKTKSWLIRFCHFESYFWIVLVCCSIWWSFISKFHHYFQYNRRTKRCIGNAFSLEALSFYMKTPKQRTFNKFKTNRWTRREKKFVQPSTEFNNARYFKCIFLSIECSFCCCSFKRRILNFDIARMRCKFIFVKKRNKKWKKRPITIILRKKALWIGVVRWQKQFIVICLDVRAEKKCTNESMSVVSVIVRNKNLSIEQAIRA